MKKLCLLLVTVLLAVSPVVMSASAESQSTTVRYTVSATVTYLNASGVRITLTVAPGSTLKAPETPTLAGHRFIGWRIDGTDTFWDFTQPVEHDLTLVATFEPIPGYSEDGDKSTTTPPLSPKTADDAAPALAVGVGCLAGTMLLVARKKYKF